MFHVLYSIKTLDDFVLEAEFEGGVIKRYDVKPLFDEIKEFSQMKEEPAIFEKAEVVCCGYGVAWSDELDLACEEIWDNGITV